MLKIKKIVSLILTSCMFVTVSGVAFSETATGVVIIKPKATTKPVAKNKVVKKKVTLTKAQLVNVNKGYKDIVELTKYNNADKQNWQTWYTTIVIKKLNYKDKSQAYIDFYTNFFNIWYENKGNVADFSDNITKNIDASDLTSKEKTEILTMIKLQQTYLTKDYDRKLERTINVKDIVLKAWAIAQYKDKVVFAEKYSKEQGLQGVND